MRGNKAAAAAWCHGQASHTPARPITRAIEPSHPRPRPGGRQEGAGWYPAWFVSVPRGAKAEAANARADGCRSSTHKAQVRGSGGSSCGPRIWRVLPPCHVRHSARRCQRRSGGSCPPTPDLHSSQLGTAARTVQRCLWMIYTRQGPPSRSQPHRQAHAQAPAGTTTLALPHAACTWHPCLAVQPWEALSDMTKEAAIVSSNGKHQWQTGSRSANSASAPDVSWGCISRVNADRRRSCPAAQAASRPATASPTHASAARTMPASGDALMRLPTAAAATSHPRRSAAAAAAVTGPRGDAAAAAAAAESTRPRLAEKKKRGSQMAMAATATPSTRRARSSGGGPALGRRRVRADASLQCA